MLKIGRFKGMPLITRVNTVIDKKIIKFIESHHLLALATVGSNGSPYSASAFYAFSAKTERLTFSTDPTTIHGENITKEDRVSAIIALETKVVGKVQGVQIVGRVVECEGSDRLSYIAKFPYAAAIPSLHLWSIEPIMIKLTDNRLGFGKKLIWNRE